MLVQPTIDRNYICNMKCILLQAFYVFGVHFEEGRYFTTLFPSIASVVSFPLHMILFFPFFLKDFLGT